MPREEKEGLESEETPQTHYFRMRNHSQAFLSGFLLEAKLSWAKNNLSGESRLFILASLIVCASERGKQGKAGGQMWSQCCPPPNPFQCHGVGGPSHFSASLFAESGGR